MKDHEIEKLVSQLKSVAIQYGYTQQLRERIRSVVVPRIRELNNKYDNRCCLCAVEDEAIGWRDECLNLREYKKAIEWISLRLDSDSIKWIKNEMKPHFNEKSLMEAIRKSGDLK